jgi:Domain of unknown function (DUF4209)
MTTLPEGADAGAPSDANLIRQQLEAIGLSQREAARQLGLDDRSLRYYCAGKLPVPRGVFLALRQLEEIRQNDRCLAMLEDGTMSTSDGQLSAERFRNANRDRRAALDTYMTALRVPPDPDALPVPDAIECAYEEVDAGDRPIDEVGLAGQLAQIIANLGRDLEAGEAYGAFAVVEGLRFMSRRSYGEPVWDMHWQPLSGWTDKGGTVHHSPDVAHADDATIREWSRRARGSQHPVLRARYGDLAWEVAKYRIKTAGKNTQAPRPIKPNADDARRAIDAYLEAVVRGLAEDEFRAWHYLGRAVELAATIRDADRLRLVKAALFDYRAACDNAGAGAYIFWLFDDIVWEQKDVLALSLTEKAIAMRALERTLELRADPSKPLLFDPYQAQDAADRLGRWQGQSGYEVEARRAATKAGGAFEAAAAQATGFTAISLLERQAARYREAGDMESVARVERAIREHAVEAESEMMRITRPYEISREKLDKWSDQVAGATLEEGFQLLVSANLIRKGQVESSVLDLARSAVFQARVPMMVMGRDGFASAHIGSVEEDLDGRAVHLAATLFGNLAPFLNVALARFREKHSVDLEKLMTALADSALFPLPRLKFVRDGVAAWFTEDWIKATHILVPQIEAALRDLLAELGGAVMKRNVKYGGFQAIGLGEVLSHNILRQQLPEDIHFHLRVLLQDPRGINLRGESAHGLAAHELFGRGIANWVIHAVIMLGLIRLRRTT